MQPPDPSNSPFGSHPLKPPGNAPVKNENALPSINAFEHPPPTFPPSQPYHLPSFQDNRLPSISSMLSPSKPLNPFLLTPQPSLPPPVAPYPAPVGVNLGPASLPNSLPNALPPFPSTQQQPPPPSASVTPAPPSSVQSQPHLSVAPSPSPLPGMAQLPSVSPAPSPAPAGPQGMGFSQEIKRSARPPKKKAEFGSTAAAPPKSKTPTQQGPTTKKNATPNSPLPGQIPPQNASKKPQTPTMTVQTMKAPDNLHQLAPFPPAPMMEPFPLQPYPMMHPVVYDPALMGVSYMPMQMEGLPRPQSQPMLATKAVSEEPESDYEPEPQSPPMKFSNRGNKLPDDEDTLGTQKAYTNVLMLTSALRQKTGLEEFESIQDEEDDSNAPCFPERPEDIPKDKDISITLSNHRSEELATQLMDRIEEENKYRRLLIRFSETLMDPQIVAGVSPEVVKSLRLLVQKKIAKVNEFISNILEARGKVHRILAQRDRIKKVIKGTVKKQKRSSKN